MTDVHTPARRSYNMSQIRGSDTRPELALRTAIWHLGLRYRLRVKLPGKPDFTFPNGKVAVFVDGCFWHGCPSHLTWPRNNAEFWREKITNNIRRDAEIDRQLTIAGWRVVRIWEHDVRQRLETCVSRIKKEVRLARARK